MQQENETTRILYEHLEKAGYRGKIVSIGHIRELEKEIMTRYQKGLLDPDVYDEYLASFDFACHDKLSDARSLIIVAVPQPQVRVVFKRGKKSYPVIIPPAYAFSTDQQVADLLDSFFSSTAYHFKKVRLPEKLLAARSGLAQYGKNNITYVKEMGSFQRLVVFISDYPCAQDSWGKATVLEHCEKCSACMKACPTDAIASDRFQLYAERCLTFHNERAPDFPAWLRPGWHNSLVGCMICQKVCPANKEFVKWIEAGATFDNEEADLILNGASEERLPPETVEKLKKQDLMAYADVLGRNLRVLMAQQDSQARSNAISF